MQELLYLLRNELRGSWRYRWIALAVAWGICLVGWALVYSLPNVYRAGAQVYVDAQSRLAEVMGQVGVSPGVGSRVFVVRQAMLGRPQLERVASETGMDRRARTPEEEEELYDYLRENVQISTGRTSQSSNLYTITFEDSDRMMALAVVRTLLNTFVEDVLKLKERGTSEVDDYLNDQLSHYSNLLEDAEQKLADFKKKYVGLLPGENGGVFDRLQAAMGLLQSAQLELQVEIDRREELRRQMRSEDPLLPESAATQNGVPIPGNRLSGRIESLEQQRAELLLTFTDKHPDVIALNEQLEQLYAQQQSEREAMSRSQGGMEGATNATNPVYQNTQIALNDSSVRIATLRSQVQQHQASVDRLREEINTIPEVEAELATLTRDYDQYRALYNEIMLRKERERMGKVGEEQDVVSFNVTEPPAAAMEPVGPKRTLMLFGVLIFGLGCGGGVAFLLNQINPVFHDVYSLRRAIARPILGQVSMTLLDARRRARRVDIMSFAAATSSLVIVFVGILVFQGPAVQFVQNILVQTTGA